MALNLCYFCKATCCKDYLITITSFDVLRVMEKTGKNLEEFAKLHPARIFNPDNETILECYYKKEKYDYLLIFKSHPCCFLDKDNRCTIYDFSPLGCKFYPFRYNGEFIEYAPCSFIAKTIFHFTKPKLNKEEYLAKITSYKKIVAKWNALHGEKEWCMKFLLDESRKMLAAKLL